ncbi:MAG: transporter related protein [Crocinitomicaceae bacterium]|jgi:ABC-type lipoprotein export system ATPase subunit|nr:transporter related protein [Crocinitomicaceae bacterium]
MNITLNKIMPFPLASIQHGEASIWGREIFLEGGKKIMLNAASGKGKSTFTHTIFGLRTDYDGTLLYDTTDVRKYTPEDWTKIRREKISVVFQDLQLFHNLTVRENLLLKNSLSDVYSEAELKNFLAETGIENKWNDKCGILSMGQQQRVAIIRALCQPFDWLILDEPFSHLDKVNSAICMRLINERCDQLKAGFVLTTLGDDYDFTYDQELIL